MSELSVRQYLHNDSSGLTLGYDKSEADKAIAELEESHKMEVEQLLIEIAELKKACNDKDGWCRHTLKENRHHKYKRCLAMALVWLERSENSTDLENELVSRKRCCKWLELAEKFKETK